MKTREIAGAVIKAPLIAMRPGILKVLFGRNTPGKACEVHHSNYPSRKDKERTFHDIPKAKSCIQEVSEPAFWV